MRRTDARRARLRRVTAGNLVVLAAIAALVAVVSGSGPPPLPLPGIDRPPRGGDPFAYIPGRADQFVARAIAGEANPLFAKSPDGAVATAARVAAWRPQIDRAAAGTGIDPALVEAIVFLESAGLPDAIAGGDPAGAAGLTQIVAQTGRSLLGMRIDLSSSRRLTSEISLAEASGDTSEALRLETARERVDDRFDPRKELAATVRYLELARARFGRLDLATESYHMGIANLQSVLDAYDGGAVPYVQLFFDTALDHHAAAYQLLSSFGDDSWTYYWRVLAAEQIMALYRSDRVALERLAILQTDSGSAAEVLHPPSTTAQLADPTALAYAYANRVLLQLPRNPRQLGLQYDPSMGALAGRLGVSRALYRGLRAPALDLLIELAARVRALAGVAAPLIVTSTVLDRRYQQLLGIDDPPAAAGWAFTIGRSYVNGIQRAAFQAMLDRLQALNVIAWQRYPDEIEVTVASDASSVITQGP